MMTGELFLFAWRLETTLAEGGRTEGGFGIEYHFGKYADST